MIELNVKSIKFAVRTRAQRRSALASIIKHLNQILEAENNCLSKYPGNLTLSVNYHKREDAVDAINWAINFLTDAYGNGSCIKAKHYEDDLPF